MSRPYAPDVLILAPNIINPEQFDLRYADLTGELTQTHGLQVGIVESHSSYEVATDTVQAAAVAIYGLDRLLHRQTYGEMPVAGVVRDLTMPTEDRQAIHDSPSIRTFVNPLALNTLVRRKDQMWALAPELQPATVVVSDTTELSDVLDDAPWQRLVVKPATGAAGSGVIAGTKSAIREQLAATPYAAGKPLLVQEYIDTSRGIPELDIDGMHNIRLVMVGGKVVLNCVREKGDKPDILYNDVYGRFGLELPAGMQQLAEDTMAALTMAVPDAADSVIAIDLMRGIDQQGQLRDVVCEVNRRPLRISRHHLLQPQMDPTGLAQAALAWDRAEAQLLASKVNT